ncbi:haloacid dehalogenase-like hydrolase [bacterium]|nr:haloacid dehalogenase-like hydrolase [bacterium]
MNLLLFDIDGTLLLSGGAGKVAMERSFETVWGIRDALRTVPLMGRTDPGIVRQVLQENGFPQDDSKIEKFREYYFWYLEEEIGLDRPGKALCPGVLPLLKALSGAQNIELGLLTGNWRYSGLIKLRYFGIDGFFRIGAYADDSMNRDALVPVAMERFRQAHGMSPAPETVFVIGDTPFDIRCGKPHGVRTVAVATGVHAADELQAEFPDFLFADLTHTDEVVNVLTG